MRFLVLFIKGLMQRLREELQEYPAGILDRQKGKEGRENNRTSF